MLLLRLADYEKVAGSNPACAIGVRSSSVGEHQIRSRRHLPFLDLLTEIDLS